ncbi:MAG: hypothetical protein AB2L24_02200 [Mangrovibacterium sp.]
MKRLLIIISFMGLVLTILPSVLVFYAVISMRSHFYLMIAGMILWFATAPFWMKSKSLEE